jgi:hypothetical protein
MARNSICAVLVAIAFSLSGCYGQDLSEGPIEIWFDPQWDADEQEALIIGMERHEEATGVNFFDFVGEVDDSEYTMEDGEDGRHVVYKLTSANEDTDYIESRNITPAERDSGSYLAGYGLHTDILLYWYHFRNKYSDVREDYLIFLANLATHESGHFLGLGHNNVGCDESLMTGNGMCVPRGEYVPITEEDVDQLCVFYDCP